MNLGTAQMLRRTRGNWLCPNYWHLQGCRATGSSLHTSIQKMQASLLNGRSHSIARPVGRLISPAVGFSALHQRCLSWREGKLRVALFQGQIGFLSRLSTRHGKELGPPFEALKTRPMLGGQCNAVLLARHICHSAEQTFPCTGCLCTASVPHCARTKENNAQETRQPVELRAQCNPCTGVPLLPGRHPTGCIHWHGTHAANHARNVVSVFAHPHC